MSPTGTTFMFSFIICTIGLIMYHTHLLSTLLCLEGMMLSIFMALTMLSLDLHTSSFILPLTVLTLSACEAGVGLALLVASARTHNTASLKNLNLLQC
ncbi:NADH dehydrogenase subunit 4L (mitochondrion) [Alligator mississippiensis]|uniref:NADH-ubiquinone oxidoreductase chain 4L n=1 Tax=Alligator mississippiensis TaxID=8496 RepID=O47875_ALLMI|nr:NADH dehydrogenase subunit 4L [Alligator mississippiensis]AAD09988.1 NADH dehydrogenase subunit IV L [Alligator mississippiensis]CAA73569.1 NADH dehydrogenase subunit 4L [Alligator mississippiensis]